ncbi:hypothetical protein L484_019302 [Morus notabilis]|uniref:Expansin-like EG45 domain-containing protein n=1 Tax=Morus notabilis TaxID=981085 RepID=W9RZT2_9ROSA|nr:hypothetical protein L484_019302 [Morus notabilis]
MTIVFFINLTCFGKRNDGVLVGAASRELYGHKAICGKKYKIKCINADYKTNRNPCKVENEVVVTMVDYCPGCKGNHIDLSKHAFDSIAHLSAGRIKIEFQLL